MHRLVCISIAVELVLISKESLKSTNYVGRALFLRSICVTPIQSQYTLFKRTAPAPDPAPSPHGEDLAPAAPAEGQGPVGKEGEWKRDWGEECRLKKNVWHPRLYFPGACRRCKRNKRREEKNWMKWGKWDKMTNIKIRGDSKCMQTAYLTTHNFNDKRRHFHETLVTVKATGISE